MSCRRVILMAPITLAAGQTLKFRIPGFANYKPFFFGIEVVRGSGSLRITEVRAKFDLYKVFVEEIAGYSITFRLHVAEFPP